MQLVQPPHQGQVLFALGHRFVIETTARNADQFALPLDAQFETWGNQIAPDLYRPSCLHFFLSRSKFGVHFCCKFALTNWKLTS